MKTRKMKNSVLEVKFHKKEYGDEGLWINNLKTGEIIHIFFGNHCRKITTWHNNNPFTKRDYNLTNERKGGN